VVITRDEKKNIANKVVRHLHVSPWMQLSMCSLLESSGEQLQKAVHREQAARGFNICFESPY
jgi:hypothetical protein